MIHGYGNRSGSINSALPCRCCCSLSISFLFWEAIVLVVRSPISVIGPYIVVILCIAIPSSRPVIEISFSFASFLDCRPLENSTKIRWPRYFVLYCICIVLGVSCGPWHVLVYIFLDFSNVIVLGQYITLYFLALPVVLRILRDSYSSYSFCIIYTQAYLMSILHSARKASQVFRLPSFILYKLRYQFSPPPHFQF